MQQTLSPPVWMTSLMDQVTEQLYAADVLAPLGCHYYHNQALNEYEISLFVSLTEILGGELDGNFTASRFQLDILSLQQVFTSIDALFWQGHHLGEEDQLGPHISIQGTFQEQRVWLRILGYPPETVEHGRFLNIYEMKLHDLW